MNAQVLRRLHIRHAPILDQAHCLKLELSRELPPLHDAPPVPSKHLTRCLRNRVQATPQFTPAFLPSLSLSVISSAKIRRIYLSATMSSESEFIRTFGRRPERIEIDTDA